MATLAATFAGPPASAAESIPWIDAHTHFVCERTPCGQVADTAVEKMDEAGVRLSVVMSPPRPDSKGLDHAELRGATNRHPGRFVLMGGGDILNPMIVGTPPDQVSPALKQRFATAAEAILAAGVKGFGEMGAHHLSRVSGHPSYWTPPDHSLFLLLADIAGRQGVPIDLHMEPVSEDGAPSPKLFADLNPPTMRENMRAFERLLAHNREAIIVWAHAGRDQTRFWTPALSRELFERHPNLHMSLAVRSKMTPAPFQAMTLDGLLKPAWSKLIEDFPDRFVIGTDRFYAYGRTGGPADTFAQRSADFTEGARVLLAQLSPGVARKVACENAERIYRLGRVC
ncbi:MAG: amidohydrolase family protein [Pseudomonadota bacterium]